MKKSICLALFAIAMSLPDASDAGCLHHKRGARGCGAQRAGFFQRERHVVVQRTVFRGKVAGCQSAPAIEVIPAPAGSVPQRLGSINQSCADVLACVNAERARYGLPAMVLCPVMSSQAQAHVERFGYVHSRLRYRAENIAKGQASGAQAVGGWLGSRDGHREVLLMQGVTRVGIGNVGDVWILCVE